MTVRLLIYPLAIPAIVFASISWVAHIYNFTTWFLELTNTPFVNMPDKNWCNFHSEEFYIFMVLG